MVVTVHRERRPDQRREPAAGLGRHGHRAEHVAARAVLVVSHQVGRVLVEAPARVHRHHLHAATHAQHRQHRGLGRVQERELPRVPVGPPVGRARVRFGVVVGRVDVGAPADHQSVEAGDHGVRRAGPVDGRQQHRHAAACDHRLGVLRGQHVGAPVPHPPPGLFPVGREPDQGSVHRGAHRVLTLGDVGPGDATVDQECVRGHERRVVGGEEEDRRGHLLWLAEPAHGPVHQPSRRPLGVAGEQLLQQRSVHGSRAQRVHAHALTRELHAELARHREHAALGRRIGDLRGGRPHHRHERRGVDDRPPALLQHVGQRGLAAQVDRGQVDLLHPPPGIEVGVQDRVVLRRADAGVVERDVDRAVGVLGGLEERVDLVLVGDVDMDVRRDVAAAQLLDDLRAPGLQAADDDLGALGDEPAYRRQADARATAGDDRDPVLHLSRHVLPLVLRDLRESLMVWGVATAQIVWFTRVPG